MGIENELGKYFSYFQAAVNFRAIQKTDFKLKITEVEFNATQKISLEFIFDSKQPQQNFVFSKILIFWIYYE